MLDTYVRNGPLPIFNGAAAFAGEVPGSRSNPAQQFLGVPLSRPMLKQPSRKQLAAPSVLRCEFESGSEARAPAGGGGCPFHSSTSGASVPQFEPATVFKSSSLGNYPVGGKWPQEKSAAGKQQEGRRTDVRDMVAQDLGIPGPRPWNLFENVVDLSYIARYGIEEAVLHYSRKYGPLCRFSNGITAWTFVNDPAIVQHICVANAKNYSRRYLPAIYEYVTHGKGILGSQGAYNLQHRKMCAPPFKNAHQLRKFTNTIADKAAAVVATLGELSKNGPVVGDMATHMQRLTLDIVGEVAFSKDFGQIARISEDVAGTASGDDMSRDRLLQAVNVSQECMGNVFITPLPILKLLKWAREPGMHRMDRSFEEMRSIMTKVIQERRESWAASGVPGDDLLGVLLQAEDEEGRRLTDEELWEDVHDIMGAGHETTASTTIAALYCISQTPGVEEKVLAELRRVLGGRAPKYDDLPALQYTTQVVKEVLRLYPSIPLFPREVEKDDVLPTGHKIPAGDVVFMSTYAMGRNGAVWEDPEKFNPDRFSPEEEARRHKYAWVQFGAGPRMCLGSSFAMMSVTQIVATLVQAFHFEAIRPRGEKLPFSYDITMNFPGGIVMEAVPR